MRIHKKWETGRYYKFIQNSRAFCRFPPGFYKHVDIDFENARLGFNNRDRAIARSIPLVHLMIFHVNGNLDSTWLPDEEILAKLT